MRYEKKIVEAMVAIVFPLLIATVVSVIRYFVRFNRNTQRITSKMQWVHDCDEYRYWRRELRCHYLCLIPFVTRRNVMRLYRRIYHKPKHENKEK